MDIWRKKRNGTGKDYSTRNGKSSRRRSVLFLYFLAVSKFHINFYTSATGFNDFDDLMYKYRSHQCYRFSW